MISGLDHIVVLVEDIGKGTAAYEALLGCAPSWQNSGEGADRVLFTLRQHDDRTDGAERCSAWPPTASAT